MADIFFCLEVRVLLLKPRYQMFFDKCITPSRPIVLPPSFHFLPARFASLSGHGQNTRADKYGTWGLRKKKYHDTT